MITYLPRTLGLISSAVLMLDGSPAIPDGWATQYESCQIHRLKKATPDRSSGCRGGNADRQLVACSSWRCPCEDDGRSANWRLSNRSIVDYTSFAPSNTGRQWYASFVLSGSLLRPTATIGLNSGVVPRSLEEWPQEHITETLLHAREEEWWLSWGMKDPVFPTSCRGCDQRVSFPWITE